LYIELQGLDFFRSMGSQASAAVADRKLTLCHYRILGLNVHCRREQVKAAYLKLAKELHPDMWLHDQKRDAAVAAQRFRQVQEAYQCLVNDSRRFAYDQAHGIDTRKFDQPACQNKSTMPQEKGLGSKDVNKKHGDPQTVVRTMPNVTHGGTSANRYTNSKFAYSQQETTCARPSSSFESHPRSERARRAKASKTEAQGKAAPLRPPSPDVEDLADQLFEVLRHRIRPAHSGSAAEDMFVDSDGKVQRYRETRASSANGIFQVVG